MAARTKSKVTLKYKTKYRVKNWVAYEAALQKRGDVTLWFFRGGYRRLECASDRTPWWPAPLLGPRHRDRADLARGVRAAT